MNKILMEMNGDE